MNISYDIFELMDFPIAVTDGDFNIVYKNRSAKRCLGKLRKGSKITKYMSCQSGDIDLTSIKETEFDTGTPIKRALVFCSRGAFVFTFMPCMQFEGYRQISEYIRENFPGDILDFFISSYAESRYPEVKCANVPSRVYADLLKLSRKRIEPIRFSREISGLYFGKNPYNIDILSRIFPSSILTDLYP